MGKLNIINTPLVTRDHITLLPLHIKLRLMQQYIEALNKDKKCFKYITNKVPNESTENFDEYTVPRKIWMIKVKSEKRMLPSGHSHPENAIPR